MNKNFVSNSKRNIRSMNRCTKSVFTSMHVLIDYWQRNRSHNTLLELRIVASLRAYLAYFEGNTSA